MISKLWTRVDITSLDACRVSLDGHSLEGRAVLRHDGHACALDYFVQCDDAWRTRSATVRGWLGERQIDITLVRDADGRWLANGQSQPQVDGAIDADLNFSPATNLLPIRRLELRIGDSASVRAAWLRFPSFELEPLDQTYTRLSEQTYRYDSGDGSFTATLDLDKDGLIQKYGDYWIAVG